ncbi:MAG: Cdc6/Cdc18 family protein [Candidatus Thorarchaeota archaeon]
MSQRCLFDKIVNAPTVFTDETVFCADYLPEELPGRHDQLQELFGMFRSVIRSPKKAHQEVVVQGPIGSGKTTLIRYFMDAILQFTKASADGQFAAVHINCRKMNRPIPLLTTIIQSTVDPYFPTRGFSPDELLQALVTRYSNLGIHLILCLDEFEYLLADKAGKDLLYSLLRFHDDNFTRKMRLSIILVTRSSSLQSILDATMFSTLSGKTLAVNGYIASQLEEILHHRAKMGIRHGVVGPEIFTTIAQRIAQQGGDARIAIELLWRAGKRADRLGDSTIKQRHLGESYLAKTTSVSASSPASDLSIHERFLLQALRAGLKTARTRRITMGQLKKHYNAVCTKKGETPRHHTQLWKLIGNLRHKKLLISEVGPHPEKRGRTTLLQLP